jgi:RNA polymerase sigma factor (sigma-70 family)
MPGPFADAERARFPTTQWSKVAAAAANRSPDERAALADLCEAYWYPLYVFVRREGRSAGDAQDVTQGFFLRLIETGDLAAVDRAKGRFRSFLLAALKNFLINEWDKQRAAKRGGGWTRCALDFSAAEERFASDPRGDRSPEAAFDREWALALLARARAQLAAEQESESKRRLYDDLAPLFTDGETGSTYREAAERLGMKETAVKVAVFRLRRRFREILREQIALTVAGDEQIDDEIRDLFDALRR